MRKTHGHSAHDWTVMVGWGNEGGHRGRSDEIAALLRDESVEAWCLKVCANGQPGHPLYHAYPVFTHDHHR